MRYLLKINLNQGLTFEKLFDTLQEIELFKQNLRWFFESHNDYTIYDLKI